MKATPKKKRLGNNPGRVKADEDSIILPFVTPRVLDFTNAWEVRHVRRINPDTGAPVMEEQLWDDRRRSRLDDGEGGWKPGSAKAGLLMTPKQIRSRGRRKMMEGLRMSENAYNVMVKPIEEWDAEELARGRPRDAGGYFRGKPPDFITREMHEKIVERFKTVVRSQMNVHTVEALKVVQKVLESEDVDDKGKPVISGSTKLDAAKFLIEHVIGKPTQPTTTDISVKLQGILGTVMVNPAELPGNMIGYQAAHRGDRMPPPAAEIPRTFGNGQSAIDAQVYEVDYDG